jgi:nicotinate phosphoribosyltransferase
MESLCDTDFYKLTMMQVVLHQYAGTWVRYAFKWRNWNECKDQLRISPKDFIGRLKDKLDKLCSLRFSKEELEYLAGIPYLKPDFIEYLRLFQLNRAHIHPYVEGDEIKIKIEGPWISTILFEVPVLAITSQLYTESCKNYTSNLYTEGRKRNQEKVEFLKTAVHREQRFMFSDFGTRRRASHEWHWETIDFYRQNVPEMLVGTSNVLMAKELGLKVIGTMAHEYLQAHQQLGPRLVDSQKAALQAWANEYRGELGIALSDVLGFRAFLKDFDRYFALLFDGCRHDSGDPIWWGEELIAHYNKLRIDPKTKSAVFSDGLTFETAVDIFRRFHSRINTGFGIGTYLTNDIGLVAPQIVIKMTYCNGKPVAKVSDSPGKGMCEDAGFLTYLHQVVEEKVNG